MSDASDACAKEVAEVIERHLGALLAAQCEDPFTLPLVQDWVLVIGVTDADGSGSTIGTVSASSPFWCKRGLLAAAAHQFAREP